MKGQTILLFLVILSSILSCTSKIDTDEIIIKDIFPQIVDSLSIKYIIFPPPPPPPNDSILDYPELEKWKKRIKSIEAQEELVLIIVDTLETFDIKDLNKKNFQKSQLISDLTKSLTFNHQPKQIDLKELNQFQGFNFLYFSELEKEQSTLFKLENKKYGGILKFSRVYLNKKKDLGILKISYFISSGNGESYIVTIEKKNNQWKILNFYLDWVS